MVKRLLYYGAFLGLSLLIHFLLIQPRPIAREQRLKVLANVVRDLSATEQALKAAEVAKERLEQQLEAPPTKPPETSQPKDRPEPPKPTEFADNAPVRHEAELESLRREFENKLERVRSEAASEIAKAREEAASARQAAEHAEERARKAIERAQAKLAAANERHREELDKTREQTERLQEALARETKQRAELEKVLAAARERANELERNQQALARDLAAARANARTQAEPALAGAPSSPSASSAQSEAERARRAERSLGKRLAQLDDWDRFARAAQRERFDAEKVPVLRFAGDKTEAEFLELMRFYGMEVIVFPPTLRYLVHVDLIGGSMRRVEDPKAFIARFSRRSIEQRGSYWKALADRVAARFGGRGDNLIVQTVVPYRTASYLAWKEIEVLKAHGLDPSEVAVCYGSYRKTERGTWVVEITHVRTFDDRLIDVRSG